LEALRIAPAATRSEAPRVLDPNGTEVARAVASLGFARNATGVE
jgi:hypothetical protein